MIIGVIGLVAALLTVIPAVFAALAILAAVLSGAVLYCPHGRPVSYRIPGRDLDKRFRRIV